MQIQISKRMSKPDFQGEFVDAMLKAATAPDLISFGGGLPNPISFPVEDIEAAVNKVLQQNGVQALQYSSTAGYGPLRSFIAKRYARFGVTLSADDILITNGSQQALDMLSAVLVDPGDEVLVERPSYLAALQTFHLYDPEILTVGLTDSGADCDELEELLKSHSPKFFYAIPNFQNPTGLTYSKEVRERVAALVASTNMLMVEDNPYGELRFRGEGGESFGRYLGEQCCMLGTFSKTVSPGMRIGWIACPNRALMEKLLGYKQVMDLHTNIFCQMVLAQYLEDNDLDAHMARIKNLYQHQADVMMDCIARYMPEGVRYTKPKGGMFIWATMPDGLSAVEVQNEAVKRGVLVTAGDPFYEKDRGVATMRLNYSNCTDEKIERGIQILSQVIRDLLQARQG